MSIEAMKQALEALELWLNHKLDEDTAWQAHTSLRQAIAEAEKQEPVAVVSGYYGGQCVVLPTNPAQLFNSGTAFYTHPPKREPDYSICLTCGGMADDPIVPPEQRQPKREWVGLTMDEIDLLEELYAPPVHPDFTNDSSHCLELIRHVEAKLKEKNGLS